MKSIVIRKPGNKLKGVIPLPASKSISNRLLMMNALCNREIGIKNISEAADTCLLQKLLGTVMHGNGRKKVIELDTANAGTVMRFLTAFLPMQPGKWVLTGSERMKQRPVGILAEAMKDLGASIDYLAKPGYPPLLINGGVLNGRELTIDPGISSQFTTALLLIAPYLTGGLTLRFSGAPVSSPYTDMTIKVMQLAGAKIKKGKTMIRVHPGSYQSTEVTVESDWSAAAFWYEAAVLAEEADIELLGLRFDSLQGDAILPAIFQNFGVQTEFTDRGIRLTKAEKRIDGFYFDFTNYPDIAQAVISTCAGIGIRGRFEGVQSLQIKETDRLRAMRNEIEKLGTKIVISGAGDIIMAVEITPAKSAFPPVLAFETYGDHRTAMSLAPLAFKTGSVRIFNPDVVGKSYPRFWDHLKSVGFDIQ